MPSACNLEQLNTSGPGRSGNAAMRVLEWTLAVVILFPMLLLPLARDQGIFAYVGQIILDGGTPYRDVFEIKGPGIHYVYALAMAVFGQSAWGIRLFFFGVALIGTRLAASLGERIAGSAARLPVVVCFAFAVLPAGDQSHWNTGQAEDVILILLLASILSLDAERPAIGIRAWGAGVLLGLSFLFKPTAAASGVLVALTFLWSLRRVAARTGSRRSTPALLRVAIAGAAGFVTPLFVAALYLWHAGALADCWSMVVRNNLAYAGRSVGASHAEALRFAGWGGMAILTASAGLIPAIRSSRAFALTAAAFAGAWMAVIAQGKYFEYHWTPAIGFLAILGGCGAAGMAGFFRNRLNAPRLKRPVTVGVSIALLATVASRDIRARVGLTTRACGVLRGDTTAAAFRGPYRSGAAASAVTSAVADLLRTKTDPSDTVLVWGHETLVNFESDRRSPTRFVIDGPLSADRPNAGERRREFMRDLTTDPPRFIVAVSNDRNPLEPEDSATSLRRFPELAAFVAERYTTATRIERFHFHRLTDVR